MSEQSVRFVKGVGPSRERLFANLGVHSIEDLLFLFPRRYEDRRNMISIAQARVGEWQTIRGRIFQVNQRKTHRAGKDLIEVILDDQTGRMVCVWFNQAYLKNQFRKGRDMICFGKVEVYKSRLQMVVPEYEIVEGADDTGRDMNRIVPVYPLTRGMSQRYIRKIIHTTLTEYCDELKDDLPVPIRNTYRLRNLSWSLQSIHYPESMDHQQEAHNRLSFEEFYFYQLSVLQRRIHFKQKKGIAHRVTDAMSIGFAKALPFALTGAQKRVIREIRNDMNATTPMLRLVQGDVGCGKTVVALFGCCASVRTGHQAALMAPTEILARQHYLNWLELQKSGVFPEIRTALLVSGLSKEKRLEILDGIATGRYDWVVGTHALITDEIRFKNLSYVVVDEQHKFGVRQRALLSRKGRNPDVLVMTATPIPRTLCLTLYGDLDISIIDECPQGRGEVKTSHFPEERIVEAYDFVRKEVSKGRQAYIVYPIIEESEKLDLKAAMVMFRQFQSREFKGLRLALIHGQMKRDESEAVMSRFQSGEIDILVATTVLEVGVDVANATVMLIEHAERFGLAQLHQLRGRIGRGKHDSYCLLTGNPGTEEGRQRLQAILTTTDGFEIARRDLEIRGPGHYFGRHQHGFNELRVANPATQMELLEKARAEALALHETDPGLVNHPQQKKVLEKRYPLYLTLVEAG